MNTPIEGRKPIVSWAFAFGKRWWDGLWLCLWFLIAACPAYFIPVAVMKRLVKATAGGVLEVVVEGFAAVFLVIVSPVIMSKVFRELDYPGWPSKRRDGDSPGPGPDWEPSAEK